MNRLAAAALVVFCRRPGLGNGKQRLGRVLGDPDAFAIATALLECTLEDAEVWPGDVVISPANRGDTAWAERLVSRPAWVEPQPDGNLGQRLNAVDAAVRARGCEHVMFIGTDAPSLTVDDFLDASEALECADVVLAPATDGGVTLMGSRTAWPCLGDLPWSEPTLGNVLEELCRRRGLSVVRTRASYDVDEPTDLVTASRALTGDNRPARRRLRNLLVSILETHGRKP